MSDQRPKLEDVLDRYRAIEGWNAEYVERARGALRAGASIAVIGDAGARSGLLGLAGSTGRTGVHRRARADREATR